MNGYMGTVRVVLKTELENRVLSFHKFIFQARNTAQHKHFIKCFLSVGNLLMIFIGKNDRTTYI